MTGFILGMLTAAFGMLLLGAVRVVQKDRKNKKGKLSPANSIMTIGEKIVAVVISDKGEKSYVD